MKVLLQEREDLGKKTVTLKEIKIKREQVFYRYNESYNEYVNFKETLKGDHDRIEQLRI